MLEVCGSISVVLDAPTALEISKRAADKNDTLAVKDSLHAFSAFLTDEWAIGRATFNLGVRWHRYHAFSLEQRQYAYTFGPLDVPAMTFPEVDYFTWDKVVPRIGGTYDLTGDGKTVIKVNYSLYAFNPGIAMGGNANPNQRAKTVTYAWRDNTQCPGCVAGDGLYQPGEEGTLLASSLAGNIRLDPDLQQPTSTQATAFVEREVTEGVGARVGFVYYTVKDQVATYQGLRPQSAYTVPFNVLDRGADNAAGTSDDANLTLYGIPNDHIGSFPPTRIVMSLPNNGTYKSVEATLNKRRSGRWSMTTGFGYTWMYDYPAGYPNTANGPFAQDRRLYSFKATGTYNLPYDIMLSGVYRLQSGANYARTLSVAAPASCACTFTQSNLAVTPYNEYSLDNISKLDLRLEKSVPLGDIGRLRVFFDVFNLANHYAADSVSVATGATFQRPILIMGPRTARFGARFLW